MAGVRDNMIAGAARLLAQRGLQATSFSTVLAETNSPRGSIYHHFPGGKDELVTAAIEATRQHALNLIDQDMGAPAVEITKSFLAAWRALLTYAHFDAGCALVAVTVAAETGALRERSGEAFRTWRDKLASALETGGLSEADASATATLLLAASEGAVVVCRAEQDIGPFELVAAQLVDYVQALPAGRAGAARGTGRRGPGRAGVRPETS
ncbi:MAG TPA: TetR/AcrR family transcriptional regulator [Streptosporangiaceae bacterium]|nr:TetR/AcrR family transcriptional regulator [Streptosporangiaceae bacterium]